MAPGCVLDGLGRPRTAWTYNSLNGALYTSRYYCAEMMAALLAARKKMQQISKAQKDGSAYGGVTLCRIHPSHA